MKKVIIALVLVNFLFLVYYGIHSFISHQKPSAETNSIEVHPPPAGQIAPGNETAEEHNRVTKISATVSKSGRLSEEDTLFTCDFLTKYLDRPGIAPFIARWEALAVWESVKAFTPKQQTRITNVLTALLNRKDAVVQGSMSPAMLKPGLAREKIRAAAILGNMPPAQAVPLLLPLLNYDSPKVRAAAKESLNKLGYKG